MNQQLSMADFATAYNAPTENIVDVPSYPPLQRPLFPASHVPSTPAGKMGPFLVNTYFLQDDRKSELIGPVANSWFKLCKRRA
jgi:hypothetical protein